MKLKNARAGDVLIDNDGDIWYFDGLHFFCIVEQGIRHTAPHPRGRLSLLIHKAKPFKRLAPKKRRHK